jgi:hypothetical protein
MSLQGKMAHSSDARGENSIMDGNALSVFRENMRRKYQEIYVVIAPPRCSSTAFARVFWEHPDINFYCHEPFDQIYYKHASLIDVLKTLDSPLDLEPIKRQASIQHHRLVVKEMTFQVGEYFPVLQSLATQPLVFLIRNPLLSIQSRMQKLQEGGNDPLFPYRESGWGDLLAQVMQCRQLQIPYLIVDSADFRNFPSAILQKVFIRLGLSFAESLLRWQSLTGIALGKLDGEQAHWYQRVLSSTSIEPANEPVPEITSFPERGNFREHVCECLRTYELLREDPRRIVPYD